MKFDRTKIAIEEIAVTETKQYALQNLYDGRKNPTDVPVIMRRNGYIVIDMSVPRALFGNTLEEPKLEDWDTIVAYIKRQLQYKFLFVQEKDIESAAIWYLELGKNILIPAKYCMYSLISKLGRSLTKYKTTLQRKQYVNETGYKGSKTAILTDKRDVGFYDKTTKELANGAYHNRKNKNMFAWLLEQGWQVLRYEVKMCNAATVKQTLRSFGVSPTFKAVWWSQIDNRFLAHWFEPIKQTLPPTKPKKESLMKQIHAARKANVSLNDICAKIGMDELERTFGATALKAAFITAEDKVKGKKSEVAYGALRKKRKATNRYFKDKKEYVTRHIENAITQPIPIRVNMETGEIEGVLK